MQFDPMASSSSAATPPPPHNASGLSLDPTQLQYLQAQGFPTGMIQSLSRPYTDRYPLRVWILDNGSTMQARDAHILRPDYTYWNVSRWQESMDCVRYHADLNMRLGLATRFALLNRPTATAVQQYMSLYQSGPAQAAQDRASCQAWLEELRQHVTPQGPAPLLTQLKLLRDYIVSIAPQLKAQQHVVPIVMATQGLLTDDRGQPSPALGQAFVEMLKSFADLPVSFVLRLCTDDEQAFEFYNSLDARLPQPIAFDVLDDFYGEALEVYLRNPWLCYTIVLHRFREMGYSHVAVLDVLDERAFTLPELHEFVQFLFGPGLPDPRVDWSRFLQAVQQAMARERPHWNPVLKTVTPWINVGLLHSIYSPLAAAAAAGSYSQQQPFAPPPRQPQPQQTPFASQSQPPPQTTASQPTTPPQPAPATPAPVGAKPQTAQQLTTALDRQWAKIPPALTRLQPINVLLGTLHTTRDLLPTPTHAHLQKWNALSRDALANNDPAVLKKAVRKVRLWLHPDKLPPADELSELERLWCRTLWDVISEAWSTFGEQSNN